MQYTTVKIAEIKHPMKNFQVMGKIENKKGRTDSLRRHYTAFMYDDTGKVMINLWRNQVDQVNDGDTIYLLGAFTQKGKRGMTVSTWEEKIFKERPKIFGM